MMELSPNKQALLKIRELKQQIAEMEQRQSSVSEPIAIVSMACRFPRRSSTPEAFWKSLIDQTNEVTEIPHDRWDRDAFHGDDPEAPGKMYARNGCFLEHLDLMDPEFFGISPREATWVDPQQRLLMEVGWEALERAGWKPENIGPQAGIFVGWMHNDYQNEASDSFLNLNPYIATGAAGSFLCGRLAYYLGLQGPSVAIDTACSSSLVAIHLACQSLQLRECNYALVGGVNAICSPTTNILTCKLKALSPSGHSRAFDAAADGYLRGEGCGVVTLRRLADAERDGDPILGIVCGSAIGHNGFSSGLTAPNPKAQQRVIQQALERAQLSPQDISYLEAHGTGTELGDPIEMQAAAAALGSGRSQESPLLVGSVKTNIGHLEAAAGMAGLIKVLLALENNRIPGQLNFENPNPHIPWEKIPVRVLAEPTVWPEPELRIAGVSAFGMSGTNAHVVVASPSLRGQGKLKSSSSPTRVKPLKSVERNGTGSSTPQNEAAEKSTSRVELFTVSGKSEEALLSLAERLERRLAEDDSLTVADVAYTLGTRRSHFEHRAALSVRDRADAIQSLKLLARSGRSESIFRGHGRRRPKMAWQFTGQGSQYVGMARGLYENEPVFRQVIDYSNDLLGELREESLTDVVFGSEETINHTSWTQPAIFAVQMGLAKLLKHYGMQPDVVLGHSVGQYAAACVAGIMSWEDGLRLIAERGRLIGELPCGGKMLAVFAPLETVENLLTTDVAPEVSVAALNGTHIVLSGEETAIEAIEQQLQHKNIRSKPLVTSHAFHSAAMDGTLEPFRKFADKVQFKPTHIPLICNVSGRVLEADRVLDGEYWAQHIRAAVKYSQSINTAQEIGCDLILEIGPQSVLSRMAAANWKKAPESLVSCLNRDTEDSESFLKAISQLYVLGVTPDFDSMFEGRDCRQVLLPTYPFQRRRFWGPDKPGAFHSDIHTAHPLLGGKLSLAGAQSETRFESFIEPDSPSWLPDHEVMEQIVLPGAAYLEMAIAAARQLDHKKSVSQPGLRNPEATSSGEPTANSAVVALSDIVFEHPLQPTSRTALQTVVRSGDQGHLSMESFSCPAGSNHWTRHFTAKLISEVEEHPIAVDREALEKECDQVAEPSAFYRKMQEVGLNYGPDFQTIQKLSYSKSEVLAHLKTNSDIRGFFIAPTLLDGALHCLAVGLLQEDDGNLFLPVEIGSFHCFGSVENEVWCHAQWLQSDGNLRTANLTLFYESGEVAAKIQGLKVRQISRSALRKISGNGPERLLYQLQWQDYRLPASSTSDKTWLIITNSDSSLAESLAQKLKAVGHSIVELHLQELDRLTSHNAVISDSESEPSVRRISFNGALLNHWMEAFDCLSTSDEKFIPDGIVWMFASEDSSDSSLETKQHCAGLLNLAQTLQQRGIRNLECGLQLITQDAIAIEDSSPCNAEQTKYWGLGRVIGAEQPTYRCRLIDMASVDSKESVSSSILEVLLTETNDNQLVIRDSNFFVPRMKQVPSDKRLQSQVQIKPDSSYLITGGLGMLGRQAAKWLANQGATQVLLVSRRSPDESACEFINDLKASGCDVVVHSADLGSRSQVETLFQRFGADRKPLAGVIHAAGVLDDALIGEQNWDRFRAVLAPKVNGAQLLDEFTRTLSLDFFVLYSSVASVLGSPGQSNYATANSFLDGLAWQRRSLGLPATSINWGPWTEGMASEERIKKLLSLQGITPLAVSEAHAAMESILAADIVQATVLDVDWRRMRIGLGGESPAMLADLSPTKLNSQMADSALVGQLKQLRGQAQKALLIKTMQEILQAILSTSDAPETDRPLVEMGLDSLMAVEFSTELQTRLGDQFAMGPTMLFDHPTIDAIAEHVLEMMAGNEEDIEPADTAAEEPSVPEVREREPIAIVGMSCRFPGASDVDEFWQNLLNGVDSVREIPDDRWDIDRFYDVNREPGKMYTREGGFLEDIGDFDASFFNISDQEACWIDPQHRMLVENSYRALEHAGISPHPLADPNVGVFMGIMGQDYAFLPHLDDEEVIKAFQGAGLSHSAGVGRISYLFGFEGPSMAIDTASSSSLVAVHQAARSLQDGKCNMALAGGVNAILAPVNSLLMSKAGLLSADGRCKSFSANADGFGRGEGCGVVVLKRLSDAQRDGDTILAVVRGGAVAHNGFSGGITSPSGKAQARIISEALQDAKIAPIQVQYLEAHGTGTEFGDPMELNAAASVYGKGRKRDNPLLVGSVKANISHLEAAGGISGLIKTVLSIHHGIIPPQINFESPSPHIPWNRMPVKVVEEPTPWPTTNERIAGVTALGLVGTNAHIILSGEPIANELPRKETAETSTLTERPANMLVLSARDPDTLFEVVRAYEDYLQVHADVCMKDICHTAAVGRRHYEHRLAITFNSREEALTKLAAIRSDLSFKGESSKLSASQPKLAWLFTGEPSDSLTAAQDLFKVEPVFRELIAKLDGCLNSYLESLGRPSHKLSDWLSMSQPNSNGRHREESAVHHFALQAGLAEVWKSWGIEPDVVLGQGIGQYPAACMAGVLSYESAFKLIVQRELTLEQMQAKPDRHDELLDGFEAFADTLNYYPPSLQLICSLSGEMVPVHRSLGGSYWREHIDASDSPQSIKTLLSMKPDFIMQMGPDEKLKNTQDEIPDLGVTTMLAAGGHDQNVTKTMLDSLGKLYVEGINPDFRSFDKPWIRKRLRLPHYPFQKKRYWITEVARYVEA